MDHCVEYYDNQCKMKELYFEMQKLQSELEKCTVINKVDKDVYQPWPPYRSTPIFYYKWWTCTFGSTTVFTDIILIEPIWSFKPGWHFNKVIFDICKCTITFQNIDNFIHSDGETGTSEISYKEYTCIFELDEIVCDTVNSYTFQPI